MADKLERKEEKHPRPLHPKVQKGKYLSKPVVWSRFQKASIIEMMYVAHVMLENPWLYDHDVLYRGKANTYMFLRV